MEKSETGLASQKRLAVKLGHPSLGQTEDLADFLHRQFVPVIEGKHHPFLLRDLPDHVGEEVLHVRFLEQRQGVPPLRVRKVFQEAVRAVVAPPAVEVLEPQVEGRAALPQRLVVLLEAHPDGPRHLEIVRKAPERVRELRVGALHGVHPVPDVPRKGVGRPELVEHRAPDAVLGVRLELHRARLEPLERVEEPDHARADEIVLRHPGGQAPAEPPGGVPYERQEIPDDLFLPVPVLDVRVGRRFHLASPVIENRFPMKNCSPPFASSRAGSANREAISPSALETAPSGYMSRNGFCARTASWTDLS